MEGKTTILDTCVDIAARELCSLLDQLEEGMNTLREFPWWEYPKEKVTELHTFYTDVLDGILWDLAKLYMELDFDGDKDDSDKVAFLREFKELKPVAERVIKELKEWKE